MLKRNFKDAVYHRLKRFPHLVPLFTNAYQIPERLYEYNPDLFVVYNLNRSRYEVHSLAHYPSTFAFDVPYGELDVRVLRDIWENDIRVHGRNIFRRLDTSEESFKRKRERESRSFIRDFAKDSRKAFAALSWGDSLTISGYGD